MYIKIVVLTLCACFFGPFNICAAIGPIQLSPAYQAYLWGGDKIATQYHREGLPACVAESWELSDRSEGMSFIKNGPFAGFPIKEVLQIYGADIIGNVLPTDRLPILIKIIDANKDLSVQVHPNETMAALLHSEAKAESWYALSDGFVYAGFEDSVTLEQVKQAIESNTLESLLHKIEMRKGEMINIPGGTVHAIGHGSLILEIQQNSNTTYRLYDWGRTGPDGQPRPLHIHEGLAALDWDHLFVQKEPVVIEEETSDYCIEHLLTTPYYKVRRFKLNGEYILTSTPKSFLTYFCEKGNGTLFCDGAEISIQAGDTFIIPALSQNSMFKGKMKLIEVSLP